MLICARTYHGKENASHIIPKLLCDLSECYCIYAKWEKGKYVQSSDYTECPRYEKISEKHL